MKCNPEDWKIIQEILSGRYKKLELLLEKYEGMIYSQCLKFAETKEEAEDMAQEIFLKAFESLSKFRGESMFSTWLFQIGRNLVLEKIRKKNLSEIREKEFARNETQSERKFCPESELVVKEESESLMTQLKKLPQNYKIPIMLYYFENMSYQEISEKLNLKMNTLKSHILRGKELLKNLLQNEKKSI
ncbi:MAG TPA: RNA polymerase sigma factor [Leptospiraceae bacterium]|nr:RNA polymerase sigma factor [Leptospiraceae bacterium]